MADGRELGEGECRNFGPEMPFFLLISWDAE